jgi:hypothetical protein
LGCANAGKTAVDTRIDVNILSMLLCRSVFKICFRTCTLGRAPYLLRIAKLACSTAV